MVNTSPRHWPVLGNVHPRFSTQPTRPPPRQRPIRRDWNGVVCFSCGKSGHAATRCPNLDESFPLMQPGWRTEKTPGGGGVQYDPTPGDARPTEDGKRRLIRGEGFASRVSGTVRPQDPGGGATPVAAPRRIRTNDVSDTAELSGGGSVGPLQNFGGVGRGDQCWGHFTTGVSM